jgi:DNA-binding XRE family transcriptional regulator
MHKFMKNKITKDNIVILVRGKEIYLKSSIKIAFANIINELIDPESASAEEIFGEEINNPRLRVAKYLKGIRKREGLTQIEVCKKLKIQQANLSKMESGERPVPKNLFEKISKLYNIRKKMLSEKYNRP